MDPTKKWITKVSIFWQEETLDLAILADTKLKKIYKVQSQVRSLHAFTIIKNNSSKHDKNFGVNIIFLARVMSRSFDLLNYRIKYVKLFFFDTIL